MAFFKGILSVALLLNFSVSSAAPSDYRSYFSPVDNLHSVLLSEVEQAKKTLDISIYTFNSTALREAIINRLQNVPNLKVRILVRADAGGRVRDFFTPMNAVGAEIRYVARTNHHKFMVIDGKKLLNSSGNFSESSLAQSYDENLFICTSCKEAISEFQEEFEYLYANSNPLFDSDPAYKDVTKTVDNSRQRTVFFTSRNFTPFVNRQTGKLSFRSSDAKSGFVEQRLVKAIDRVQKGEDIRVATGHLRSWNLFSALKRARQRGVRVDLVVDSQEYVSEYAQDLENQSLAQCELSGASKAECYDRGFHFARLAHDAGIHVHIKFYRFRWDYLNSPQMHHKYMIIGDKVVYTGSYNWSRNSEMSSFENVAVIENKKVVASYIQNFEFLLNYGRDEQDLHEILSSADKTMPVQFAPRTLSVPEIDEARRIACEKCPQIFCSAPETIESARDEAVHDLTCRVKKAAK